MSVICKWQRKTARWKNSRKNVKGTSSKFPRKKFHSPFQISESLWPPLINIFKENEI